MPANRHIMLTGAALAAVVLTGCSKQPPAQLPGVDPSPVSTPSASASATPDAAATPSPSPTQLTPAADNLLRPKAIGSDWASSNDALTLTSSLLCGAAGPRPTLRHLVTQQVEEGAQVSQTITRFDSADAANARLAELGRQISSCGTFDRTVDGLRLKYTLKPITPSGLPSTGAAAQVLVDGGPEYSSHGLGNTFVLVGAAGTDVFEYVVEGASEGQGSALLEKVASSIPR